MKQILAFIFLFSSAYSFSQYQFSGYVDNDQWQSEVYLSLVDDYRKIEGLHREQLIAKVQVDSNGYFKFEGDQLDSKSMIYRIHVDNCPDESKDLNHFTGHCPDSKEVLFIAKNSDTITFPFGFDKQMFCDIESTNERSKSLLQIDSLKEAMRFAYTDISTEANRELNTKKWFSTFQEFSKRTQEPLAELYAYSFLTNRQFDWYDHYLEDLKSNPYYAELGDRLNSSYPKSPYSEQFSRELAADKYMVDSTNLNNFETRAWIIGAMVVILIVFYFFYHQKNIRKTKNFLLEKLTNQEQKILDLMMENKSNKEIAETMFISLSTVKSHVNNIYKKFDVQSRDEIKRLFSK